MKLFIALYSLLVGALLGQEASVTSRTLVDSNGHRVWDGADVVTLKTKNGSETTERLQSINGRMAPLEHIEERIVRDDSSGRVVERIIKKYDQTGTPGQPIKEVIEEHKGSDGSSTISRSSYQGDINGRMALFEKSITEIHKSGSTENADTTIQKATINGSFETVEKQTSVTEKTANGYQSELMTYNRNLNGDFAPTLRYRTEHVAQGQESTDNTARYELNSSGQLQLHDQTVEKKVTRPDGSQDVERNLFRMNVPGTVSGGESHPLQLFEQQLVERKPGAGDSVVETLSVRRATASDPGKLGPARQIAETVCRGKCD